MTVTHRHSHTAPSPLTRPQWLLPGLLGPLSRHLLSAANGNASRPGHRHLFAAHSTRPPRPRGARVETRITASLEELDHALATAERRVVLLGGDGSLHAAANSRFKTELALIPAGGANNVARSLGIPPTSPPPHDSQSRGARGRSTRSPSRPPRSNYLAVEGVSAGFHALARSRYTATNSADVRAGIRAGLGAVARFEPFTIAIVARRRRAVSCASASSSSRTCALRAGLRVPGGTPRRTARRRHDRRRPPRAARPGAPPSPGHALGRPGVTHTRARTIKIATGGRSPVIADTTNVGDTGPAFDRAARARHRRSGGMTSIAFSRPAGLRFLRLPYVVAFAAAALAAGLGRAVTTSYLPLMLERINDAPGLIGMVMLVNAAAGMAVPLVVGIWSDRLARSGRGRRMPVHPRRRARHAGGLVAIALGSSSSYSCWRSPAAVVYVGLNAVTTAHRALDPGSASTPPVAPKATSARSSRCWWAACSASQSEARSPASPSGRPSRSRPCSSRCSRCRRSVAWRSTRVTRRRRR